MMPGSDFTVSVRATGVVHQHDCNVGLGIPQVTHHHRLRALH